ncbi:MAG: phenylalanine--tRNA ligase subunit beta [Simkaniaceae bacterium]|nr:phenylalanine--tRNA ligase subunit beta [Candidatus Sacchlamyda saccharinae]
MKVSLNWLKEYLDLTQSPEKIADAMTLAGLEAEGMEEVGDDVIFEIGLTPNLGHCMSVVGIARELSAILELPLRRKEVVIEESDEPISIGVKIEDKEQCYQYSCREVRDIAVGPSPEWLIKKLESVGLRSVNNVVDVGNLVMMECGQPLHMFDRDQLEGDLVVRAANGDGKMQTLDEVEREIPDGVLLICDEKRPVAFAGVMGELSSAVSEKTINVVIEAAQFTPQSARKTSRLLNLRTDSGQRFERGIDRLGIEGALDMAAAMLGGLVCKGSAREVAVDYTPCILEFCPVRCNRLLGVDLSVREMCMLLGRLEIEVLSDTPEVIQVAVPSYRNDLTSAIDLIEEVGRMYGFNNIPRDFPRHASSPLTHAPIFLFEEEIRTKLVAQGLQECLTCDLISPKLSEMTMEKTLTPIKVLHPASVDQSILRTTLLPGLLEVIKFNLDRQNANIAAFEVGHIHFKEKEEFFGEPACGIILTGKETPYHFEKKPDDADFFDAKGHVENLLSSVGLAGADFEPSHLQNFHPGRQARVMCNDVAVGALGEVHPRHLKEMGIGKRVYYAEINLRDLMDLKRKTHKAREFSLFPGSERDWTIPLDEKTPIGTILENISKTNSPLLEKVYLLDLYKSDKIGKDRKNATFRFTYRDPKKTIAFEEVEKEHAKITEGIAKKFAVL